MRIIQNIVVFGLYLFLQVFLFNYFTLFGTESPQVFLLFLLMLPWGLPFSVSILLAFLSGILVDIFSTNLLLGGHAFSAVLMMALRDGWVKVITSKVTMREDDDFEFSTQPISWFVFFLGPLVFIYSLAYHIVDAFSFSQFHITIFRSFLGAFYSFVFCLSVAILFYRGGFKK